MQRSMFKRILQRALSGSTSVQTQSIKKQKRVTEKDGGREYKKKNPPIKRGDESAFTEDVYKDFRSVA